MAIRVVEWLCLVPEGGRAQDSCFGWGNARLAVGEDERGARHAGDWGGIPHTIDLYGHQRLSGKSSVSGGNVRLRAVDNLPDSTQGTHLRVGIKTQVLLLDPSRWESLL